MRFTRPGVSGDLGNLCPVSTTSSPADAAKRHAQLAEEITGHRFRYYVLDAPVVSDGQFDDGAGPSAQRSFPDGATYTVKLRVTDNNGATAIATAQVSIANQVPAASFGFLPASPATGRWPTKK